MPTTAWNKFGYSLEFDVTGNGDGLTIDFESVAELIVELDRRGRQNGLTVDLVIVAPEYVDRILGAKHASGIEELSSRFMRRPAWVRHDEHLHVDFKVQPRASQ
jgi:penicillin-insensitive murein endopeptidase